MEKYGKYLNGQPIDNNKFMKILIACGVTLDQLTNYVWYIEEIDKSHKFYCSGFHPLGARIGITKENIHIPNPREVGRNGYFCLVDGETAKQKELLDKEQERARQKNGN